MRRYGTDIFDVIDRCLSGFVRSESYEDVLGGTVTDWFGESDDRITAVLSGDRIHILSHVGGKFSEKIAGMDDAAGADIREHVTSLISAA